MTKGTRQLREREHFQVTRQLGDLISIGPAMLRDFEWLGIRSVAQLARQNPQRMYARLNRLSGQGRILACWMCFARPWRRRGIRSWLPRNANGGIGAESGRRGMDEEKG